MSPLNRLRTILAAGLAAIALASPPAATAVPTVSEPASAAELEQLREEVRALTAEIRSLREARVDDTRTAELERRVEALTREIERLRVGEAAEPVAEKDGVRGLGPSAAKVYASRRGVSLGGYGEMLFSRSAGESELDFVRAILYTGYKFSDSILFNSEIEFEHASTEEGGSVSVEFAYLDFLLRPEASVRAGLLLVPMGFINELHEPTTFLGTTRPSTEREIIPSTWRENGIGVFGERGRFGWRAVVVNGFDAVGFDTGGLRDGRQNGAEAKANDFAFAGRLDFSPTLGSLLGASVYLGNSGQGHPDFDALTKIFEVHGELRQRGFEARALYARATLDDVEAIDAAAGLAPGGPSVPSRLQGGYLQVGYDVLSQTRHNHQALIPFVRLEKFLPQDEVPAGFVRDRSLNQRIVTAGTAWKPIPQAVIKADFTWLDSEEAASDTDRSFRMQLGYIF